MPAGGIGGCEIRPVARIETRDMLTALALAIRESVYPAHKSGWVVNGAFHRNPTCRKKSPTGIQLLGSKGGGTDCLRLPLATSAEVNHESHAFVHTSALGDWLFTDGAKRWPRHLDSERLGYLGNGSPDSCQDYEANQGVALSLIHI